MSQAYSAPLPPLTGLPEPPRVEEDDPSLVPPPEILLESRRALTRRLLVLFWRPALVLVALWAFLCAAYVVGTSPTLWLLALLVAALKPDSVGFSLGYSGFSGVGLGVAFLLVPVIGTLLSLALVPVASRLVTPLNPRFYLCERDFQRAFSNRITLALMAPVLLTLVAVPLLALIGTPLHWTALSAGPISQLAISVVAVQVAWVSVRSLCSAHRVLGIPAASALEATARYHSDPARRRAAAAAYLVQDRRHLPPTPGSPQEKAAFTPRGWAVATRLILRSSLAWVVPAMAVVIWFSGGIDDLILVFTGIGHDPVTKLQMRGMSLTGLAIIVLVAIPGILATGFAPALAILASRGARRRVLDQRTYMAWDHRARVNPWEARVVALTGWFTAAIILCTLVTITFLLSIVLGKSTPITIIMTLTLWYLIGLPFGAVGASVAMRSGLRDVLYGPAGWYTRRNVPIALIAPDIGTRTQRGQDPAVRAEMRRRLRDAQGEHSLDLFDVEHAEGERLWVDDSLPGATPTQVRAADIARGILPDFGASASAGGADGAGSGRGAGSGSTAADGARFTYPQHDIPDSVTGLNEIGDPRER